MQVATKFSVGDIIWHLERTFNEEIDDFEIKVCPCPKKIVRIDICCWKIMDIDHNEITYLTEYLDGATAIEHLTENKCFATKEQAEQYVREQYYGK